MINKQFHCFSLKLSGFLMMNGFVLFEIQKNKDGYKNIYMFKDSPILRDKVAEYTYKFK